MKTIGCLLIMGSFVSLTTGCRPAAEEARATESAAPAEGTTQTYPISGRIISVALDKRAITLDHEDIPGLMKAMQMQFTVEDPQIVEGVEVGNNVEGRLKVENGKYIITELNER